jgi:UDP-N-acetylglucosamine 2-epimerase (non-hydrolysing)
MRGKQKIKFCTVIGTRPKLTKMSLIITEINKKWHENVIIHTVQHYGKVISELFLD